MRSSRRHIARELFSAGLHSVDGLNSVADSISLEGSLLWIGGSENGPPLELDSFEQILVVGAGKASTSMAAGLENILGEQLSGGLVVTKDGFSTPLQNIPVLNASHPIPDERGQKASQRIISLLTKAKQRDLVFVLLSGGSSALLPAPAEGISLNHKRQITSLLLESGAPIDEINTVRKHLSLLKGGRMASLAYPSRVVTLVISDVVGDRLDVIGSGPTVPDTSTYAEALNILNVRHLTRLAPIPILTRLKAGMTGALNDTPKPRDPVFTHSSIHIIANNNKAVQAIAAKAVALGYKVVLLDPCVQGEARVVASAHVARARRFLRSFHTPHRRICFLSGGETTVRHPGTGLGGRNQEYALAAAIQIQDSDDLVVLSAGTDGDDGNTGSAGAIVDGHTIKKGRRLGLDGEKLLQTHNSHVFLRATGDTLDTGPTLTNVMDIQIILCHPKDTSDEE